MRSYHILIGERDPFMQRTIRHTLEAVAGYQITFHEDGERLVNHVQDTLPDLVITEALLPGMDGFRVCQTLKENQATRHIPVIIFTWLMAEQRAIQAGADAFIIKPLDTPAFLATIQQLISQGERLS
ncbi:MAG: response regulator [Anaerolineales bacterium]